MSTITKEQAQSVSDLKAGYTLGHADVAILNELARIALASLEAEPVAFINGAREPVLYGAHIGIAIATHLYDAPPAAVSVPDVLKRLRSLVADPRALPRRKEWISGQQYSYVLLENVEAMVDDACLAAMLQGEPTDDERIMAIEGIIPDGLSTVCAEAYQVVGVMAEALGVFDDVTVQKILDNLSQQKLVHGDVLPFSLPAVSPVPAAPQQE